MNPKKQGEINKNIKRLRKKISKMQVEKEAVLDGSCPFLEKLKNDDCFSQSVGAAQWSSGLRIRRMRAGS